MININETEKFLASLTNKKTGDIHLHAVDKNDCGNTAESVCRRLAEMNAGFVVLTQHGVLTQVEAFRRAADKYRLKFIPGIEAYYRAGNETTGLKHIILIARSFRGWIQICRAVSGTQDSNGLAVMTRDDLWKYFGPGSEGHGEVIATTACISGIVADVLRTNELISAEIGKKLKRANFASLTFEEDLDKAKRQYDASVSAYDQAKTAYDQAKGLAAKKFAKKERALKSMAGKCSENDLLEAVRALENEKAVSRNAEQAKPALQAAAAAEKKKMYAAKRNLEEKRKNKERYDSIMSLEKNKLSEEELFQKGLDTMKRMQDIFGRDCFYAEVQYHGIEAEKRVYPMTAAIARKLGVPIVASNDVHTVTSSEDELLHRRMLRSLRYNQWSDDETGDDQLYIKYDKELAEWLLKILPLDVVMEAMANIPLLAEKCLVEFKVTEHYPKLRVPSGRTSDEIFDGMIAEGIRRRFPGGLSKEYRDRLEKEVCVIKKMGYVDYHLVVCDFLWYASLHNAIPFEELDNAPVDPGELAAWKEERGYTQDVGMSTGVGRGSAVGSLVCYLLGITNLDPVVYGLLFERFLNPERISMPDIDSDISRKVRPRVIEYIKRKYGTDCVCGITTQNAQAPKGAVRDAARCYSLYRSKDSEDRNNSKMFLSLADQIAKKIPAEVGVSFDSKVSDTQTLYEQLISEYSKNEDALKIIHWAKVYEGSFTAYGAHAAGIVITDGTPVSDIVPLRWNSKLGIYTTQCEKEEVEENGMLKFDLLGLKTLDVMNDCLWQLHREGIDINVDDIPIDDEAVYYEIFSKGNTNSVFQFESSGMKNMLKKFRPTCFEDLIILVSMFRPGPLQYLDDVIKVKNGKKKMTFLTPELRPILAPTYAAITYQEQVMAIFQELAGYTLGGADLVRRAMSKKKMSLLEKERHAFVYGDPDRKDIHGNLTPIRGCVNSGIDERAANELFDQMTEFAKYCFNKSHAASYAKTAYITGYLKYHYPAEFITAAMNWAEKTQRKDPIPGLMAEAKAMGVEVCAPDVNVSGARFTTDGKKIFFGLSAVKSVGTSALNIIAERRNGRFMSFHDFYRRCRTKKNALENLIYAGAFDEFTDNRGNLASMVDEFKLACDKICRKESVLAAAEEALLKAGADDREDGTDEQFSLGMAGTSKKASVPDRLSKRVESAKAELEEARAEYDSLKADCGEREDPVERINREHELLGAYVTKHPLDEFPEFSDVAPIRETDDGTTAIYGVISNIEVKKTKKAKKPMAVMTVEDRTGKIKAILFPDIYASAEDMIAAGKVAVFEGCTKANDWSFDEEEDEKTYDFIVNRIIPVDVKKEYVLRVTSLAVFFVTGGESHIIRRYGDRYGSEFYIHDMSTGELRKMTYRVSSNIEELKGISRKA